jgi:hypothetical protein
MELAVGALQGVPPGLAPPVKEKMCSVVNLPPGVI